MMTFTTKQGGLSLIEMMIGIAVGLLALLAVTTIYVKFHKSRTVETSLMETQSNGAMALYLLERDIDRAGYGFMNLQDCSCNTAAPSNFAFCETFAPNPTSAVPVLPLVISNNAVNAAGGDNIYVQYGAPNGGLSNTTVYNTNALVTDDFTLKSAAGIVNGDIVVMKHAGHCAEYQVSAIPAVNSGVWTVNHAHSGVTPVNPTAAMAGYDVATAEDQLVNLGQYVSKNFYVGASAQLMQNTRPTYANDSAVVDNIVYMKAEVGLDTDGDHVADTWQGVVPVNADYSKVMAVRVGLVSRTQVKDSDSPTPATLEVLPAITGGGVQNYNVPDTKYRYKVYYSIIPLRNMIWNQLP